MLDIPPKTVELEVVEFSEEERAGLVCVCVCVFVCVCVCVCVN